MAAIRGGTVTPSSTWRPGVRSREQHVSMRGHCARFSPGVNRQADQQGKRCGYAGLIARIGRDQAARSRDSWSAGLRNGGGHVGAEWLTKKPWLGEFRSASTCRKSYESPSWKISAASTDVLRMSDSDANQVYGTISGMVVFRSVEGDKFFEQI
jgi:hypothetical protein